MPDVAELPELIASLARRQAVVLAPERCQHDGAADREVVISQA